MVFLSIQKSWSYIDIFSRTPRECFEGEGKKVPDKLLSHSSVCLIVNDIEDVM
jgi:hypothetical protein